MDELAFRTQEAMEFIQVRMNMASETGMNLIRQYSDEGRRQLLRMSNDPSFDGAKESAREMFQNFLQFMGRVKDTLREATDMEIIYEQFRIIFRDEISRNNLYFVIVGLGIGTASGIVLGMWMARPNIQTPIMKAIAARSLERYDVDLCKSIVPQLRNADDILIRVRAVSINRIDYRISRGYGRTLRSILQNYDAQNPELPLVLGRGCAGIVEAVGKSAHSGLEIGDEVWVVSPWYEAGLGSELVVAPESRVERKPFIIGFEGAASLPYSGCLALSALQRANLNEHNCYGKRILIEEGSSPVGCVLTQLIKKWGGTISATCSTRSAPVIRALGADELIILSPTIESNDSSFESSPVQKSPPQHQTININFLLEELNKRYSESEFDVIFITTLEDVDEFVEKSFRKYLNNENNGLIVNTVEAALDSDEYGFLLKKFYSMYVRLKRIAFGLLNLNMDWDGPHLCHNALDRLAGYVNDGLLQTVVDLVYTPQDASRAVAHICSNKSIGNTIVTFR